MNIKFASFGVVLLLLPAFAHAELIIEDGQRPAKQPKPSAHGSVSVPRSASVPRVSDVPSASETSSSEIPSPDGAPVRAAKIAPPQNPPQKIAPSQAIASSQAIAPEADAPEADIPQSSVAHRSPSNNGSSSGSSSGSGSTGTGFEWRRYQQTSATSAPARAIAPVSSRHSDQFIGQSAPTRQDRITESGARPNVLATAGWAKDMPLSLALRQIIPTEYEVRENGVSLAKNVSWSGDRPWPEVLNDFGAQGRFVAHINWERKEVSLAPQLPAVARLSAPAQPARIGPMAAPVLAKPVVLQPTVLDTPVAVIERPVSQTWTLNPQLTLRGNVEQWASKAGWKVVWKASDYPIVSSAQFTGEFSSPDGPLAKLIGAYETSDQPLLAQLTTMDKVVYVKNKYYERTEVTPTSPAQLTPEM